MMKIDKEKCIGCGACASICPEVFEVINGKARIKPGADLKKPCAKEAKEGCPVNAIK